MTVKVSDVDEVDEETPDAGQDPPNWPNTQLLEVLRTRVAVTAFTAGNKREGGKEGFCEGCREEER